MNTDDHEDDLITLNDIIGAVCAGMVSPEDAAAAVIAQPELWGEAIERRIIKLAYMRLEMRESLVTFFRQLAERSKRQSSLSAVAPINDNWAVDEPTRTRH